MKEMQIETSVNELQLIGQALCYCYFNNSKMDNATRDKMYRITQKINEIIDRSK